MAAHFAEMLIARSLARRLKPKELRDGHQSKRLCHNCLSSRYVTKDCEQNRHAYTAASVTLVPHLVLDIELNELFRERRLMQLLHAFQSRHQIAVYSDCAAQFIYSTVQRGPPKENTMSFYSCPQHTRSAVTPVQMHLSSSLLTSLM